MEMEMENPDIVPQEKEHLENRKSGTNKPSLLHQPHLPFLLLCPPAALRWLHRHPALAAVGYCDFGSQSAPATQWGCYNPSDFYCEENSRTSRLSEFGSRCSDTCDASAPVVNLPFFLDKSRSLSEEDGLITAWTGKPAVLISSFSCSVPRTWWMYLNFWDYRPISCGSGLCLA